MAVDSHTAATGELNIRDLADAQRKVGSGIFGTESQLDGRRGGSFVRLPPFAQPQVFGLLQALSKQQLLPHDIDARETFGDGVLDLQSGVGLEEEELPRLDVDQVLPGAQAQVVQLPGHADGRVDDLGNDIASLDRRGGDLDDLLEPALDAAVALPEMPDAALSVAEDLDFNVLVAVDGGLFGKDRLTGRLGDAPLHGVVQRLLAFDKPYTSSATSIHRLDHQRIPDLARKASNITHIRRRPIHGLENRDLTLDGESLGLQLIARALEHLPPGADNQTIRLRPHPVAELGTLTEKAVAGMDGIYAVLLDQGDEIVDVHVRRRRRGFDGLMGPAQADVRAVVVRVDGHRRQGIRQLLT